MPHFFLHIRSGDGLILDEEGLDLPIEAARREAIRGARGIMAAELAEGVLRLDQAIVIQDELGRTIDRIDFEDAIEIVRSERDRNKVARDAQG